MCHKCGSVICLPEPVGLVLLRMLWRLRRWLQRLIDRLTRGVTGLTR